jgi:hypothetical protein
MSLSIFYSWQSDSPKETNRAFIESVLEKAIARLSGDVELQEAIRDEQVVLDKDTKGIPGTPPIVDTIFKKISGCAVFVPDLTFVGRTDAGKPIPNPNVLIEYGWALKELSHASIVPVMNTAFGDPDEKTMPFDMRHLRHPTTYCLRTEDEPARKSRVEETLVEDMAQNLKLALSAKQPSSADVPPFTGTPSTENPSTFLKKGDIFLSGSGEQELTLPSVQRLFLHLIPHSPLKTIGSRQAALECVRSSGLYPMADAHIQGISYGWNDYGAFSYDQREGVILFLSQFFFRTGELWGINAHAIDAERIKEWSKKFSGPSFAYFPSTSVEEMFTLTLASYLKYARERLHLEPPLRFMAGATDVKGYRMALPDGFVEKYAGRVVGEHIIYEGKIDDLDAEPTIVLRPFFEHFWDECGLKRPDV